MIDFHMMVIFTTNIRIIFFNLFGCPFGLQSSITYNYNTSDCHCEIVLQYET